MRFFSAMQVEITWGEIGLRLALTFFAGLIIGANRGEHGRPAGLRTTVLVCLTASCCMILANLLLPTKGRPWDAYTTMDVMRLPLGILTGMGFIGAGAILHKDNLVVGVTTAATLWFTTLMGFCFGVGQAGLGLAMLGLGIVVLWALEWVENNWKQRQEAVFTLRSVGEAPTSEEVVRLAEAEGFRLSLAGWKGGAESEWRSYRVWWHGTNRQSSPPKFLAEIRRRPGVRRVEWAPVAKG